MKTVLTGKICAVRVEVNNQTNLDWYALKVTPEQTFASSNLFARPVRRACLGLGLRNQ